MCLKNAFRFFVVGSGEVHNPELLLYHPFKKGPDRWHHKSVFLKTTMFHNSFP